MWTPKVVSVESLRSRIDLYKRFYVCVSDGTYIKVAKAEMRSFLNSSHRNMTHYVITEDHEKNVGDTIYVQPVREIVWKMSEDDSVWTCEPEAGVKYQVVRVERHGQAPTYTATRQWIGYPDAFVGLADFRGDSCAACVIDSCAACVIDYADRKRGLK